MTKYRCLCCGYKTLDNQGAFDLCPVCFWEDDSYPQDDGTIIFAGVNRSTLKQSQKNYQKFRASELDYIEYVRLPKAEEI